MENRDFVESRVRDFIVPLPIHDVSIILTQTEFLRRPLVPKKERQVSRQNLNVEACRYEAPHPVKKINECDTNKNNAIELHNTPCMLAYEI